MMSFVGGKKHVKGFAKRHGGKGVNDKEMKTFMVRIIKQSFC